jgi:hypothetical protein
MFNSSRPRDKFNYRSAIQRTIFELERRNRSEDRGNSFDNDLEQIRRQLRIRFVAENPESSDANIDVKVNLVMNTGQTKSNETLQPPRGIPKEVQAQRRQERRKRVKANRHSRR